MSFNNGNERRKLNAKWEHLRVQYREAGMSEDAIQAMYEFDLGVLNSERAYITNTMTVSGAADDCAAKETSDFKQYEKAVTVTDTYHETKSRFAWIGEIENEQLLTALETLKVEDLEIICTGPRASAKAPLHPISRTLFSSTPRAAPSG